MNITIKQLQAFVAVARSRSFAEACSLVHLSQPALSITIKNLEEAVGGNRLAVLGITVIAFAMVLFAMAVGVLFGRRSISGSCGGLANTKNDDGSVSCSLCSNPADACKELRERMQKPSGT